MNSCRKIYSKSSPILSLLAIAICEMNFPERTSRPVVDYVLLKKDDFSKRVKPTEAELRAYFDSHKDLYRIKEKRRASVFADSGFSNPPDR